MPKYQLPLNSKTTPTTIPMQIEHAMSNFIKIFMGIELLTFKRFYSFVIDANQQIWLTRNHSRH